ncbi:MAG: hypothetical protein C4560_09150 [Nitrospiraceae bacterium]|nr:MAG: hypothetical protein C4560_09150 [Nitrospiraceae bacterium]
MLIRNKKPFTVGVVFAISFLAVLVLIFSPVFNGKNGLVFSDDMFNKLSKGSSYFIPKVAKSVEGFAGKPLSVTIKLEKAEEAENTAKLFTTAGASVEVKDAQLLRIEGDLGAVLQSALADSDSMFKNDGKAVSERYGYDEKHVMKNWWTALSGIDKALKKDKLVAEAKAVSDVIKKGVEPGYNFYKIDANKVADHAGMMSGLLIFYVAYTMWWGYAIFYIFDGIGLSMKKAKVKKEA